MEYIKDALLIAKALSVIRALWIDLTLFHPGGSIWPPLEFFKITPKRLSLRRWNFVSFSSYFIDAFWKKIPVTDITASYDDVITKNGGANFMVKSLLNRK